jgi:hypothetical protein
MSGHERLRVHVLGCFRLLAGDTPITIPLRLRKPQELLQDLIAFSGTEVGAAVLIDAPWPDSEGDAAYHALESALYRLPQLLGARDVAARNVVHHSGLAQTTPRQHALMVSHFVTPAGSGTVAKAYLPRHRTGPPALRRSENLLSEGT